MDAHAWRVDRQRGKRRARPDGMIGPMPLETYRAKRDFARTPEPEPGTVGDGAGRFVVQRHRATALHYDTRLEIGGVLVSWAVPKGPTLDAGEKRLAMRTEDHPIEYFDFEGVIPRGEYGAGDVIIWDWGTFEPEETDDPAQAVRDGELKFRLFGERLRGRFTIVRTSGRFGGDDRDKWLLIKKRDEVAVEGWDAEDFPTSIKSGLTNDEVKDGMPARFELPPPGADVGPDLSLAREARQADFIPPMLASLTDGAFDDPGWLYEVKWDGYRVEAVISGGEARIWTRNRVDAATYFPDLAGRAEWIDADEAIVDGEVVAFDEEGRPSFSRLQDRTGLRALEAATRRRDPDSPRLTREEREAIPLAYMAFDLLHVDGRSLLQVPLEDRKQLLRRLLRPHPMVRYASDVPADGRAFTQAAAERGLEGVVAKRRDSPYQPGRRSRDWLKVKLRREQEIVVVGWLPGQGTHKDLGSLIVAVSEDGKLRHAGQVGSGINGKMRRELLAAMQPIQRDDSPLVRTPRLPQARWVEPRIVIRAEFAEWTRDGLLRQAAFKGVELDRDPAMVVREEAVPAARVATRAPAGRSRQPKPESNANPNRKPKGKPKPKSRAEPKPGGSGRSDGEPWPAPELDPTPASADELGALEDMRGEGHWQVAGHEVRLTNLDKVLFAAEGDHPAFTKRDLVRYYVSIGPTILPYLAGRGLTLQRFPDGAHSGKGFWQKDLPRHAPKWMGRWDYTGHEGPKTYVVVDRVATMAWLAQEAALEIHPWTSRTLSPREPTYALIDVDPGDKTSWEEVLTLTRLYRTALEHLGVIGLPKTTGKRGIQVWIPIRRGYTFDDTRAWVEQLSLAIGRLVPDLVSWEWAKRDRKGRARLDFTQNAINKTLVAPYAVRPAAAAPVSAPIRWEELDDPRLRSDRWTIGSMPERLAEVGDLFSPAVELAQSLPDI
jgi:bifunctional non-homologous end joining protein LigD